MINDFKTDLEYSEDDKVFDDFYKKMFPNLKSIDFCEDLDTQFKGIDKIITFKNGGIVTIDEKKRRVDYGDILLELYSNYQTKRRGWLFTAQCDYIAYAIMPSKTVYLLPSLLLKTAWIKNKEEWLKKHKIINANNETYTTRCIAIPTDELLLAVNQQMQQSLVVH